MNWYWIDPLYYLLLLPPLAVSAWARLRVSLAGRRAFRIESQCRLSGAEAAATLLEAQGLATANVRAVDGELSDFYDPLSQTLRLSPRVYHGRSLASLAIAAREVGHALRHERGNAISLLRSVLVPVAGLGSGVAWIVFLAGLMLKYQQLFVLGIILISAIVALEIASVPLEIKASRLGVESMREIGLLVGDEESRIHEIHSALAWSSVAATLTSLWTLPYHLIRVEVFNRGKPAAET